jgi:hypothetical protein
MKPVLLFVIIIVAFAFSLGKHISMLMYPLTAIIFYFYLPTLYASSRMNILHHIKESEILHIKFYPMELSLWLVSTCFFSYILSHLLSDILFPFWESLYHFTFFLSTLGLGAIIFCELDANKFHISSKKTVYKTQGRFLSFEFLFVFFLLFIINH